MKRILLALALLLAPSAAFAQCTGLFPNNFVCGNTSGTLSAPYPVPFSGGGGGGTPGGVNKSIQINAAGTFGGTSVVAGAVVSTDGSGNAVESTAIPNGVTGTTQGFTDNTTLLATDAFVQGVFANAAVTSVFGRTGAVTAQTGDYTFSQITTTPTTVAGYGITNALVTTNNLSDLTNATTARTNLGLGTLAIANAVSPPALGGTTPNSGAFTTLSSTGATNVINGPFQIGGNTMTFPNMAATVAFKSGTWTVGDCLQVAAGTTGGIADAGATCGSGGGGGSSTANTQDFVAPANFTPGTTTSLTLSSNPANAASLYISFDGVTQAHDTWSLSGAVVTFNAAIPNSVQVVEAQWFSQSITTGTVTSVSVVSANGFSGTVATPSSTPAITLATTISGYLQGNGTALQVMTASANTMLGNWTGTTGNVTANNMPSCGDTGGQHLNYVAATGITCGSGTGNAITNLTGDVTANGPGSVAATIAANAVSYSKFQQVAASSLVGNPSGSPANATGITLGTTLTFSGGALQTVALSGDVTSTANSFSTTVVALRGVTIKNAAPTDGKVLTYVAANSDLEYISAPAGNVPVGGTAGQVLAKIDSTNFNTQWITVAGSGTVTSVTCGSGLNGGTFTTTGTCSLATPVGVSSGGTGDTTLTAHSVLIGEGTSNVAFAGPSSSTGLPLISQGSSSDPIFTALDLTTGINSSRLPYANVPKYVAAMATISALRLGAI